MRDGVPLGEQGCNMSRYSSHPIGIRKMLQHIKKKYNNLLIYIAENGYDDMTDDSLPISERNKDFKRKEYFYDHLCCLREAIKKDGVNVQGYFAWSLTDNYGWASGYLIRFGIYYVDFKDKLLRRYPKYSALWFKSILSKKIKKPESKISDYQT